MIIVKVPAENSNDALGCRKAPDEIVNGLEEIYTSEAGKQIKKSDVIVKELELSNLSNEKVNEIIYKKALDLIGLGGKIIFIGGDHSISYPIGKAFFDICKKEDDEPMLIVFDAHADCKICSDNVSNNTQWLRKLVEDGFPADRIILIGLRNSSSEENSFLSENNIRVYAMKDILDFQEICDIVMELANKNQIYISIDIDAVDGVFVPGTQKPEAGGFTSRQIVYFIQRLNFLKGIRAIDINEINPEKDFNNMTVKLGTKLLGESI